MPVCRSICDGMVCGKINNQLVFVVREPFLSKQSQATIGYGTLTGNQILNIESHIPTKGIIFSDGIESDFLNFNSRSIVYIGIADEKANLVVKHELYSPMSENNRCVCLITACQSISKGIVCRTTNIIF